MMASDGQPADFSPSPPPLFRAMQIIRAAEQLRLPIIADEVYGGIAFEGAEYLPLASLPGPVPVLTVSSISKKYLVPGWRLGWIVLKDPAQILLRGRVRAHTTGVGRNGWKTYTECRVWKHVDDVDSSKVGGV